MKPSELKILVLLLKLLQTNLNMFNYLLVDPQHLKSITKPVSF